MNYAVYMIYRGDPDYPILLGLFLNREDATKYFNEKLFISEEFSFHLREVDSWEEWTKVRKLLT